MRNRFTRLDATPPFQSTNMTRGEQKSNSLFENVVNGYGQSCFGNYDNGLLKFHNVSFAVRLERHIQ